MPQSDKPLKTPTLATPGQFAIWNFQQKNPSSCAYNMVWACTIKGTSIASKLRTFFSSYFSRYDYLNAAFSIHNGKLVHTIPSCPSPLPLEHIDASALSALDIKALIQALTSRPFQLDHPPLYRLHLLQHSETSFILVATIHHILFDLWSLSLLLDELHHALPLISKDTPLPFLRPSQQYDAYSDWQARFIESSEGQKQLSFWRRELSGFWTPAIISGPDTRPFKGLSTTFRLPADLVHHIRNLSRQEKLSVHVLLMTAFQVVLHRYSGEKDIVVETFYSGRYRRNAIRKKTDFSHLPGYFVNSTLIRSQLDATKQLQTFARDCQTKLKNAYHNQDYPIQEILKQLKTTVTDDYFPGALFVFQKKRHDHRDIAPFVYPSPQQTIVEIGEHPFEPYYVPQPVRPCHLSLELIESGDIIDATLCVNSRVFNRAHMNRFIGHYQNALHQMCRNFNLPVVHVDFLTHREKLKLTSFNATQTPLSTQGTLVDLFERQATQTPNHPALVFQNQTTTYAELNSKANQLAHFLKRNGIKNNEIIAFVLPRSTDMIVAILGILKAGAAYLAIDPCFPTQRITLMLEEASVSTAISTTPHLIHPSIKTFTLTQCTSEVDTNLAQKPIPQDLAYVIYTSGSTGRPKGVRIHHHGVVNLIDHQSKALDIGPKDALLQFSNISFDAAVWEIFNALSNGATLYLFKRSTLHDIQHILSEYPITLCLLPPQVISLLSPEKSSALRALVSGGDVLDKNTASRWSKHIRLFNAYGPSECTVCCTFFEIPRGYRGPHIPIGQPIQNMQIYILDDHFQPVPIGIKGQLCISGLGLFSGYINRDDLTRQTRVSLPFSGPCYMSGDIASWTADGQILFHGRKDTQVKLRGVRIELNEIELQLRNHSTIRECVVLVTTQQKMVACVAPLKGASETTLLHSLRAKLPGYMVPSRIVRFEKLPVTANGKIDRQAVTALISTSSHQTPFIPRTGLQELVSQIWKRELEISTLSDSESFFEMGGTSISAVGVTYSLLEKLKSEKPVSIQTLYEYPKIQDYCHAIQHIQTASSPYLDDVSFELGISQECARANPFAASRHRSRAIFLTGATGFLGTYLLVSLLETTSATLYCLVRASTLPQGLHRLQEKIQTIGKWRPEYASRIIPVLGTLSQPFFSLSNSDFDHLANTIDIIYHNGALVDFVKPYSSLRPANVLGTQHIIRLASHLKIKPIHYVSTLSVFDSIHYDASHHIQEDDTPDVREVFGGYAQSKLIAERMIQQARNFGIPCSIYRLGRISADSPPDSLNPTDLVSRFIYGCLELGSIPQLDIDLDILPVTTASQAIVTLAQTSMLLNKTFHVFNPCTLSLDHVYILLNRSTPSLKTVPYPVWIKQLEQSRYHGKTNPLFPLISVLKDTVHNAFTKLELHARNQRPQFSSSFSSNALKTLDISLSTPIAPFIEAKAAHFEQSLQLTPSRDTRSFFS